MSSGWREYFAGKDISKGVIDTLKEAMRSSGVNIEINDSGGSHYNMVYDTITVDMSTGNSMKTDWIVAHEWFERHQLKEMFDKFAGFEKRILSPRHLLASLTSNSLPCVNKNSDLHRHIKKVSTASHTNIMVIVDEALLAYQMGKTFFECAKNLRFRELNIIEAYQNDLTYKDTKDMDYIKKTRKIYDAVQKKGDAIMKKFECNGYKVNLKQ